MAATINTSNEVGRISLDVPQTGPFNVVADDVRVLEFSRQALVRCRLDEDREVQTLHAATESEDRVGDIVVLDDGTVIGTRRACRELSEWRPGVARRDRPLFESEGDESLYLRPDGRQLVILHNAWSDDDNSPLEMHALDLTAWTRDRLPDLRSRLFLGWTRDQTRVVAYESSEHHGDLVRIELRTARRETLAVGRFPIRYSASAAWIACSHQGSKDYAFMRISTELDGKPVAVPELAGFHPLGAIDDDRFLCVSTDCSRHVIADLRRDLGNVLSVLPLPPLTFRYASALGAVVTCRDEVCEIWSLEGALQKSIPIVDASAATPAR